MSETESGSRLHRQEDQRDDVVIGRDDACPPDRGTDIALRIAILA